MKICIDLEDARKIRPTWSTFTQNIRIGEEVGESQDRNVGLYDQ